MSEHTPGPWRMSADRPYWGVYAVHRPNEADLRIADCDTEADARLIAAAPDLLAACEAARGWCTLDNHALASTMLDQLDAAIAKAHGEVTP